MKILYLWKIIEKYLAKH